MLTSRVSIVRPHKIKRTANHVYVKSRPLIRLFQAKTRTLAEVPVQQLSSYFAGRFDGDGNLGMTPRIEYTTREEAEVDRSLLSLAGIHKTSLSLSQGQRVLHLHSATRSKCVRDIDREALLEGQPSFHPVETVTASLTEDIASNLRAVQHAGPDHADDRVKV
jgi:hypothetical protein